MNLELRKIKKIAHFPTAGCPLLPMGDGTVKAFPRNLSQRVVTASPALHYLLPSLRDRMVHLTLLKKIAINEEPLFAEDLFISPFSASFLHEVVRKVLPVEWEGVSAIRMKWESESESALGDRILDLTRNLEGV